MISVLQKRGALRSAIQQRTICLEHSSHKGGGTEAITFREKHPMLLTYAHTPRFGPSKKVLVSGTRAMVQKQLLALAAYKLEKALHRYIL